MASALSTVLSALSAIIIVIPAPSPGDSPPAQQQQAQSQVQPSFPGTGPPSASGTPTDSGGEYGGSNGDDRASPCLPANVLNLTQWKLTLPTGSQGSPKEVAPAALTSFVSKPYFETTPDCHAVQFRAPVNGVTTSGSKNPRSELREVNEDGSLASWSSSSGVHTLDFVEAFAQLPQGKPALVGAQIHDAKDDITVFRLEGSNLYITNGNDPHYKLVTSSYQLGTPYQGRFVVSNSTVQAYFNNQLVATLPVNATGLYFKVGAYTQANCETASSCDENNFGQTDVYSARVTHQGGQDGNQTE
jgi:hypothetical protein